MNKINIVNKKAKFEYLLLDKYEAGIILTGTEIKSIRANQVNLTDAFCYFHDNELFVKNIHISEYKLGTYYNHVPKRERKLLLRKQELKKIFRKVTEKSVTIIPYRLYISDRGFAKLEIYTATGKKIHDKRDAIKEKDVKRDLDRLDKKNL